MKRITHDFKVYFYFKDHEKTRALYYPEYTLKELFREVYSKFRKYRSYLVGASIIMDNKIILYDLYPANKSSIVMQYNMAKNWKTYLLELK